MKPRIAILSVVLLALSAATFVAGRQANLFGIDSIENPPRVVRPEVMYGHLFRHIAAFDKRAEEEELNERNGRPFRAYFQRQYELSNEQDAALQRIALKCIREIKTIDERAQVIVRAYRAQFPEGQVSRAQSREPLPIQELRAMNTERDALVLSHRDELREAFGDDAFQQFERLVEMKVGANTLIQPLTKSGSDIGGAQ